MEKIPISVNLSAILPTRYSPVALVDDQGNIIGHYVPKLTLDDMEPEDGWPTAEEAEAAANYKGPTYTTAEVIAYLRSLG
jgi:hypothetical protein